jgi:hypothetical protein
VSIHYHELIQTVYEVDTVNKASHYEVIADKRAFENAKKEKNGIFKDESGDEEENSDPDTSEKRTKKAKHCLHGCIDTEKR